MQPSGVWNSDSESEAMDDFKEKVKGAREKGKRPGNE